MILCVRAGSQGERAADKLNQFKTSRDSPGSVVLPRKEVKPPVEPCIIDFIKSHRREVWEIDDSDQTTATCLLCMASLKEKKEKDPEGICARKRTRQLYANDIAAATTKVNLSGRAALWRLAEHEELQEHLINLVESNRIRDIKKIPDELWRHSSFVCRGINLSNRRAVALAAIHVGGCLGMSAVAAFSRRSSFSIVPT